MEQDQKERGDAMDGTWTTPKNIRQIGETNAHYGIYIEDYVSTYIGQYAREMEGAFGQGILIGKICADEQKTIYVIEGIVTDKEVYQTRDQLFSDEGLKALFEQRNQYFEGMEMIGEVVFDSEKKRIDTVWLKQFSQKVGPKHLFLHVDYTDRSLAFCIGSRNAIEIVESYYIFYDQNEMMQNYLIAYNEGTQRKVEEIRDVISSQARAAMEAPRLQYRGLQKDTLPLCTAYMMLIGLCLFGIVNVNHYQKMNKLETALDHTLALLTEDDRDMPVSGNAVVDDGAVDAADDPFSDLPVYVVDSTKEDAEGSGEEPQGNVEGNGEESQGNAEGNGEEPQGNAEGSGEESQGNAEGNGEESQGDVIKNELQGGSGQGNHAASGGTPGGDELSQGAANQNDGSGEGAGQSDAAEGAQGNSASGEGQAQGEDASGAEQSVMNPYREYIVQKGDTLTSISMFFYHDRGMIGEICELNGIENADNIAAGQKILLP